MTHANTAMEKHLLSLLSLFLLLSSVQTIGGNNNSDIDLLNKSIELSDGTEPRTKMDAESARRILAHFGSPRDQWEHFLGKIRKGERGAIVTALHLIEFAANEMQREMKFALQETSINAPEVVLDANLKANTPLKWICGEPAYENHDRAEHLINGRVAALEEMLSAMDSPDDALRQLYSASLRSITQDCLAMVRKTATIQR